MSDERPHLILEWHFNSETQELKCDLEGLTYIAHEGGNGGYTKIFEGSKTTIDSLEWNAEKVWLSEHMGHLYGYYRQDSSRLCPVTGDRRQEGVGPNGEYLDHLQRIEQQLYGHQMAEILDRNNVEIHDSNNGNPIPLFVTPDRGLTIYKLLPTNDTYYNNNYNKEAGDGVWIQVPQPCAMQPRSKGYLLSSYEEMLLAGLSQETVSKCEAGEWAEPTAPEFLKNFSLPDVNMHPLTKDNLHDIY